MHLVSKTKTVVMAVIIIVVVVVICFLIAKSIAEKDLLSGILYGFLIGLYAHMSVDYIKAFKKRAYDRAYAKSKDKLFITLDKLQPFIGSIVLKHEHVVIYVYRDKRRFVSDLFTVMVMVKRDIEFLYDIDEMMHKVIAPVHFYFLSRSKLYVNKSFEASVYEDLGDDTLREILMSPKNNIITRVNADLKISRTVPEDLRYASTDEMDDLQYLLIGGEKLKALE